MPSFFADFDFAKWGVQIVDYELGESAWRSFKALKNHGLEFDRDVSERGIKRRSGASLVLSSSRA